MKGLRGTVVDPTEAIATYAIPTRVIEFDGAAWDLYATATDLGEGTTLALLRVLHPAPPRTWRVADDFRVCWGFESNGDAYWILDAADNAAIADHLAQATIPPNAVAAAANAWLLFTAVCRDPERYLLDWIEHHLEDVPAWFFAT